MLTGASLCVQAEVGLVLIPGANASRSVGGTICGVDVNRMHAYVILLLLPLIGIVVFWLFPLALAIPVYLVILLVSGLMYWAIVRSMRRRTAFDEDGLTGAEATVISRFDSYGEA